MKLYSYWRSTTAYRVRVALNLKGIDYTVVPVDLVGGAQKTSDFSALNPSQSVPALVLDDGTVLTQSMAILDWLEETHPQPALLPETAIQRAHVRAAALCIAADVHPVNNLRIVQRLKSMGHSGPETVEWMNDWMTRGFTAFAQLINSQSSFCFGETPGLADLCLIPQLYNARRWGCDLTPFARLTEIEQRCLALPAFDHARPENQIDA